jgi:hypothetical protein
MMIVMLTIYIDDLQSEIEAFFFVFFFSLSFFLFFVFFFSIPQAAPRNTLKRSIYTSRTITRKDKESQDSEP